MPSQELFSGAGSFTAENRRKGQAGPPASRRHHTWQLSDATPQSPLPRATASAGGMPIPNRDWHSGHSSQPQRCWGLVGGGSSLLCLLGFHITASQRDGRISLRVSSQAQASRTEMRPRPPPPVGGRSSPPEKANGCAGPFYSAGNPSGQGPSPLVPPGCRGCHQSCACPSWRHHVTVYSSSRWFLQI